MRRAEQLLLGSSSFWIFQGEEMRRFLPGVLLLTLRHGPAPPGRRRLFETSADETIALAGVQDLRLAVKVEHQPDFFGRREVTWTSLAFASEGRTRTQTGT